MPCRPEHAAVSASEMKIYAHSLNIGLTRLSGGQGKSEWLGNSMGGSFSRQGGGNRLWGHAYPRWQGRGRAHVNSGLETYNN